MVVRENILVEPCVRMQLDGSKNAGFAKDAKRMLRNDALENHKAAITKYILNVWPQQTLRIVAPAFGFGCRYRR